MHEITFDPNDSTPLVTCVLTGPKRTSSVSLVFDTGCTTTQLRLATLHSLGFRPKDSIGTAKFFGIEGKGEDGLMYRASRIFSLRRRFLDVPIAGFPMEYFKGGEIVIDGLLGWDLIRQFHLEMDGPKGLLKVFDDSCE